MNEVYPEEVPMFMQRIAERKRNKALERVGEFRTLLQIAVAPHTRDGAGITKLNEQFDEMVKDIENSERIKSRQETRTKMEELLLAQINSFEKEG